MTFGSSLPGLTFMDINLIYDANCYVPFILRMFWFNKYFDVVVYLNVDLLYTDVSEIIPS